MKTKLFTLLAALICATTAGAQSVNYIERSWNDRNEAVVNTGMTATTYTTINGGGDVELSAGTYVISGANITVNSLRCKGVVKLILCDDAQLTVNNGIKVNKEDNAELYIYSQSYDASMGKLRVTTTDDDYKGAAIGSSYEKDLGYIEIHGGDIKAEGKTQYYDFANYTAGAGIGSGFNSNGNTIKIYGGKIEAIGYGKECAIGSGGNSKKGCTTSIYDGDITATAYQGAGIGSTAKEVSSTGSVIIYGGKIVAKSSQGAGIGGGDESKADDVTIYGGEVHATGGENCAGIGGSHKHNGTDVKIYGGKVYANGGKYGAGIGSGNENVLSSTHGGWLTVRGGEVYAQGGEGAAGIGGGYRVCGAEVIITGGYIVATGGNNAAGIGGGQEADGNTFTISGGEVHATGGIDGAGIGGGYGAAGGTVTVNGGKVYARGDLAHNANGAGIGSGTEQLTQFGLQSGTFTMTAGYVEAYGGTDAAGIGGGEGADGATVTISGGEVHACGKDYGAGIGGGENGDGGNVTITGGTVFVKAGLNETGCRAIGPGKGSNNYGSLTLGDDRCVYITTNLWRSQKANRVSDCWGNQYARISKCLHGGATSTIVNGDKHDLTNCKWCYVTGKETHTFGDEGQCDACGLIRLADEGDNSTVFTKWADGEAHSFLLSGRKLTATQVTPPSEGTGEAWSARAYTVCVPFDMDLVPYMDVMSLYSLDFIKDGKDMVFTENVPYLEAGMPYLIVMRQGEMELLSRDVVLTDTPAEGRRVRNWDDTDDELGWWRGTLTRTDCADAAAAMAYVMQSDGTFCRITTDSGASLNAFRAMYCPDVQPQTDIFTIRKGILFPGGGDEDDEDDYITDFDKAQFIGDAELHGTGISLTPGPSPGRGEEWYDLSGRKLSGKPSQRGIYLNNGRKVILK